MVRKVRRWFEHDNIEERSRGRNVVYKTYCIVLFSVFIHFYSASHNMSLSEALPTTAIDTVSEFYAEALQATVSE